MLIELNISNIALVESLRIEFCEGLNILTGETGSGKSILVDCVDLVMGGRADRSIIRTGCDKGIVRAVFQISRDDHATMELLKEACIEMDEDGLIEISRELTASGRSISRVSGVMLPLGKLREITQHLIDIHGQHDHQSLLQPSRHIQFIDAMGDSAHQDCLSRCRRLVQEKNAVSASLHRLLKSREEAAFLKDKYSSQLEEIRDVAPKPGEEEKLLAKLSILENLEQIRGGVRTAYQRLYESGRSLSAQESIKMAADSLEDISRLDERFSSLAERLMNVFYSVQDISYDLQKAMDQLPMDDSKRDRISERLAQIDHLESKYGATIDQILQYEKEIEEKLNGLDSQAQDIEEHRSRIQRLDGELKEVSDILHENRERMARELEHQIEEQLSELNMAGTVFAIRFREKSSIDELGRDDIEFLISPNPGEPLKPLASIASGGELSRIMLAFKVVFMHADGIESMIFDEIDTGISGRTAQRVGEKLCRIAADHQVLCVTHLPQIAVMGDEQYLVEKHTSRDRTTTDITRLSFEARIGEIARMIGGEDEKSGTLHARALLEAASNKRRELRS